MKTTYWIKNQYNHSHIYLRGLVIYVKIHSFILITYISPETELFPYNTLILIDTRRSNPIPGI